MGALMTIKWTDRLAIDNGIIDQGHRVIIDVTNQFLAMKNTAGKVELAGVLSDLEHYARSHFWRESELQRRSVSATRTGRPRNMSVW